MKKLWFFILLPLMALLVGCNQGPLTLRLGNEDHPRPSTPESPNKIEQIGFLELNERVFSQQCQTCHTTDARPRLATYADYLQNKDVVLAAVVSGRMPKRGALNQNEIDMVQAWVMSGALETVPTKPTPGNPTEPDPQPAPQEVNWDLLKAKVFQPKCIRCHSNDNTRSIASFESMIGVRESIDSIFLNAVVENEMPPRPRGADKNEPNPNALSVEEKRLITEWVVQGFKGEVSEPPPGPEPLTAD